MTDELVRAARDIHAAFAEGDSLQAVVDAAKASLPGIDHVGISRAHADGMLDTVVFTDPLVKAFDDLQRTLREGPCVYAALTDTVVRVSPARHEQRWPRYIREALELGLTAQLGIRLHLDRRHLAVLNLYSTSVECLEPTLEDQAEVFAAYAAMALGIATTESQFDTALSSRRVIGQAMGLVMARFGVDEEQAFRYLARQSSERNVKLRDIAREMVDEANRA